MTSIATTLLDIPEEVFRTGLFPFLRVNDLLRLRRVCQWTKRYAEDYLRTHPRSQMTLVLLSVDCEQSRRDFQIRKSRVFYTLKSFLEQDDQSSIPMPINRLALGWSSQLLYGHPLMPEFLEKYGNQIRHVKVQNMIVPLLPSTFNFFERLANLKSLRVTVMTLNEGDHDNPSISFPQSFRCLTSLEIHDWWSWPRIWKMVDFCTNLEHLGLPWQYANVAKTDFPKVVMGLGEILGRKKHKKFKYLDTDYIHLDDRDGIRILSEFVVKYDLKLTNFCYANFSALRVNDNALHDRVLFVRYLEEPPEPQEAPIPVVLRNVKIAHAVFWPEMNSLEHLSVIMTNTTLPALRTLELHFSERPPSLEILWRRFPNLEDLSLTLKIHQEESDNNGDNINPIFLGSDPEHPAFLQLTGLKRLTLVLKDETFQGLTDEVFSQVFRHMKLHELYLISKAPITSFTSTGIRALLDQNFPLVTSIEMFPFDGWTLHEMESDEFQQLCKEFPCNQF